MVHNMSHEIAQSKRAPLHFRRIEIKYKIPLFLKSLLIDALRHHVRRDPLCPTSDAYTVSSLYFDSADLHAYHEKCSGLLARCKVRLRTYVPYFQQDIPVFLEVKRRWDLAISKDRFRFPGTLPDNNQWSLSDIIDSISATDTKRSELWREAQLLNHWYNLRPTTFVCYQRFPFIGRLDERLRLTFDCSVRSAWKPSCVTQPIFMQPCLGRYCILELKSAHPVPYWFRRIVQEFDLERLSVSKYALSVENHFRCQRSLARMISPVCL